MATVNFSIPDALKEAFNAEFADENKSAVVARLMVEAIEQRRRQRQRQAAIDALLAIRREQAAVGADAVNAARLAGRP